MLKATGANIIIRIFPIISQGLASSSRRGTSKGRLVVTTGNEVAKTKTNIVSKKETLLKWILRMGGKDFCGGADESWVPRRCHWFSLSDRSRHQAAHKMQCKKPSWRQSGIYECTHARIRQYVCIVWARHSRDIGIFVLTAVDSWIDWSAAAVLLLLKGSWSEEKRFGNKNKRQKGGRHSKKSIQVEQKGVKNTTFSAQLSFSILRFPSSCSSLGCWATNLMIKRQNEESQ